MTEASLRNFTSLKGLRFGWQVSTKSLPTQRVTAGPGLGQPETIDGAKAGDLALLDDRDLPADVQVGDVIWVTHNGRRPAKP